MPNGYIKKLNGELIEIVDAQARTNIQTKQDKMVAGDGITIASDGKTISSTYAYTKTESDGKYVIADGEDYSDVKTKVNAMYEDYTGALALVTGGDS